MVTETRLYAHGRNETREPRGVVVCRKDSLEKRPLPAARNQACVYREPRKTGSRGASGSAIQLALKALRVVFLKEFHITLSAPQGDAGCTGGRGRVFLPLHATIFWGRDQGP